MRNKIQGLLDAPRVGAAGSVYRGRLTLPSVQWSGVGSDAVANVTLTIEQIADAAESRLLWTDQSVQRGIQPAAAAGAQRELPLSDGYPDPQVYIFDQGNADDMADKLLNGQQLFLNPLVWNLRPGDFEAYWDEGDNELHLYSGRIYLPDSHHRHQAILKAVRAYRDHPKSYPKFSLQKEFTIELYFLNREDEGNYFFDKNTRPKSTSLSKAYDLTTEDDLSVLAKKVLDLLPDLDAGTNRATDRLSKKAPHFVTLSTLREVMRNFAGATELEESELDGLAVVAADFLELLMEVRPELNVATSHTARDATLASAAVMMQGYAVLMRDYNLDVANLGGEAARKKWRTSLKRISPSSMFKYENWSGDFLDKNNPLWQDLGITKVHPETGRLTIANTGGTRARAGRALSDRMQPARKVTRRRPK